MTSGNESTLNIAGYKGEPQLFSGMALPFGSSVLSVFGPKEDEAVIRSSIEMILMTNLGERVMQPSFGSRLAYTLFEPNDEILKIMLKSTILEALAAFEHRVEIGTPKIDVEDSTVKINVPVLLKRPLGDRDLGISIKFDRESLFSIPARG